jgi:hypothetical protein
MAFRVVLPFSQPLSALRLMRQREERSKRRVLAKTPRLLEAFGTGSKSRPPVAERRQICARAFPAVRRARTPRPPGDPSPVPIPPLFREAGMGAGRAVFAVSGLWRMTRGKPRRRRTRLGGRVFGVHSPRHRDRAEGATPTSFMPWGPIPGDWERVRREKLVPGNGVHPVLQRF